MPREITALVKDISEALDIPKEESELYVKALLGGRLFPADAKEKAIATSLSSRGMLVLDAKDLAYLPVHPRMALSNLFRAYEERAIRQRKEKRLLVDRLTLELILLAEGETKGTNASESRGGRTTTG